MLNSGFFSVRYHRNLLDCDRIVEAHCREDIAQAVREAAARGETVRAIGTAHSFNNELLETEGTLIRTVGLNRIHGIEEFRGQTVVLVDAGAQVDTLADYLDSRKLCLGFGLIGVKNITVAGQATNSCHGGSPRHSSLLMSRIVWLELVNPAGDLVSYDRADTPAETWKALTCSMGYLGIFTRFRLQVEAQFNLDMRTRYGAGHELIDSLEQARAQDYFFSVWFPSLDRTLELVADKTTAAAMPGARNLSTNIEFPRFLTAALERLLFASFHSRRWGRNLEIGGYFLRKYLLPPLRRRRWGISWPGQHAVGLSHQMISGRIITLAQSWPVAWSFSLPQDSIRPGLTELMAFIREHALSFPHIGIIFRVMPVEDIGTLSHLNQGGPFRAGELCLSVDITRLGAVTLDAATLQHSYELYNQLVKRMIRQYGALNHVTKNLSPLYRYQRDHSAEWQARLGRFNQVLSQLDPQGRFRNHFADSLGLRYPHQPAGAKPTP